MASQSTQPQFGRLLSAVDEGAPLFASHADRSAPRPAGGAAPNLPISVALGRIADSMAGGADNASLLQEIALCSGRSLGAEVALIRAISPDGQNFVVVAAAGPAQLSAGGLVGVYSVISEGLRQADPGDVVTVDLSGERPVTNFLSNERWDFQHLNGKHLVIAPLFARGQLVGRLDLLRTRSEPFPSETRSTIAPFAAYAASALRDTQMQRAAEDHRVYQTVAGLHQSVEQLADPDTILQAVAELVVREPGCARCYAMLWKPERLEFVPVAVAGLDPNLVDILKLITLSPQVVPAFDQMVHSSKPLVVQDASKSTLLPASLVRALGIRAAMIVPLRGRRRQTLGVLLLDQDREGVHFTEEQVSAMAGMARHLSVTIENAILFEEVRASSESMAVINEIAIQLAMLTDEESLFRQLHFQLSTVLDASNFAMGLLSADRRTLDVRFAVDADVLPGSVRVPVADDPLSTVAVSGRVELAATRNGGDTQPWLGEIEHRDTQAVHSHLTVPIAVGRNVIGAMSVQSGFRNAYGPRDVDLLTSIALHTGIAIENARLYRMVQNRGDRRAVVLDEVIHRQEAERKELVDEIHDDTLQVLAACLYRLDRAQDAIESLGKHEPAVLQITDVRDSLADNISRLRKRIFSLRPATLDRLGVESALRELLGAVSREQGLVTELDIDLIERLEPTNEMLVYRVIQEAIAHVQSREGVTTLKVRVRQRDGVVSALLHHDGARDEELESRDLDVMERSDVSMLALIERVELAGGHMRVAHRAGGGSVMQITMPGVNRATLNSSVLSFEEPDVPRPVGAVDRAEGEHGFGF
jgi:GAF domain-containing protein